MYRSSAKIGRPSAGRRCVLPLLSDTLDISGIKLLLYAFSNNICGAISFSVPILGFEGSVTR